MTTAAARFPRRLSCSWRCVPFAIPYALFLLWGSFEGHGASVVAAEPDADEGVIKQINLVHFSHTDIGFTDSPSVCRELHRRYLDIAIDAVLDSHSGPPEKRFFWTAESTIPVRDWWEHASDPRREQFLEAVQSGQLEVSALACNNTPFMNAAQWQTMVHWLPEELWQEVRPEVALQNDVNGVPRAAALALLDRGVHYLFTGINEDSGGAPFPRPSAFWWRMPDGRKMFVWLNLGYGSGFAMFEPHEWRRGPLPLASDTRYRPPRAGDILRCDEASVRASHQRVAQIIKSMEQSGYQYPIVTISITSQWRFDNDPPFPPMADFVAAWNELGLQPRVCFTTAAQAMRQMEEVMGDSIPEYRGEWTDWWANGTASAPREVAASRLAKRLLAATTSPLWGPVSQQMEQAVDECYRDLCLFDEHTWGSSLSVARPYSLDTQAQFTEKAILAYRPMARAQWLLSQRARTQLLDQGEGLLLANTSPAPVSGWMRMIATCLRDDYQSIEDPQTGTRMKLYFEPGIEPWGRPQSPADLSREDISAVFPDQAPDKIAKFWVEELPAHSVKHFQLSKQKVETEDPSNNTRPEIVTGDRGWPTSIVWPGMKQPLFLEGFGDLTSTQVNAFAPRFVLADIRRQNETEREKMRQKTFLEVTASQQDDAVVDDSPHMIVFTQAIAHPRLAWGTRVLEVWKREPRARLTLRINRNSSAAPEIFYIAFPLPTGETLPRLSSGGQPYTPFADQIPGTCRDYFPCDSWADYQTDNGRWLWVSHDVPLVSFGSSPTLALRQSPPQDVHRLLAMAFNNFWYTNFVADEHGILEFHFDLMWTPPSQTPAEDLANGLMGEPVMLINPALPEDPRVKKDLFGQ